MGGYVHPLLVYVEDIEPEICPSLFSQGVRNHEAKKIMKEKMKIGDQVLFYHSNCKVPGVYGTAVVHKEGYPDSMRKHSAHPYYDAKSKQNAPTWFMVDVEFRSRLDHPVTLALLKNLAGQKQLPECVSYIGEQGHKAIKEMALVNRGRLMTILTDIVPLTGVQPVTSEAYDAVLLLGKNGGWDVLMAPARKATTAEEVTKTKTNPHSRRSLRAQQEQPVNEKATSEEVGPTDHDMSKKRKRPESESGNVSNVRLKLTESASESELSDIPAQIDEDIDDREHRILSSYRLGEKRSKRHELQEERSKEAGNSQNESPTPTSSPTPRRSSRRHATTSG
ncbi:hypothetical protein QFC19_008296 [Naganishia cerealis]|uniref:Uncharacterized protein n=1 Tax=Naganishia cerealis TaxID=610337 RepID=A0ACC2V3L8_9TREE|nr:hypothetical protein QFC19_008296 [Naganishia cerealis]